MDETDDPREACFLDYVPVAKVSRKFYPILSPQPASEVKAVILSDKVLHTHTHYQNTVTYPCTRNKATCKFCRAHIDPRHKGYLCGATMTNMKCVIIELTANAMQGCPRLLESGKSLRGASLCMYRTGKAKNSPVQARFVETPGHLTRNPLPSAFNLKRALLDMWGFPEKVVNVETGEVIPAGNGEMFPGSWGDDHTS